jgi:Uma2 family endonuclease
MAAIPLPREPEIEYPESDGKPMAESDVHLEVMLALIQGLKDHFSQTSDVYVAGNLLLYYEQGKRSSVAPDVFVVRGVPNHKRDTYLLWREGKAPCFVLEITSKSTRDEDLSKKKLVYARLGVEEYFLFDPRGEYLEPQLQGFRLSRGKYQPIAPASDGSLVSRSLSVSFRPDGEALRPSDVATGRALHSYGDWKARAMEAEERARALAEEVERLRAERADQEGLLRDDIEWGLRGRD